jgi:predicted TIM-barrel fold metal-dependent hydrolase
VQFIVDHVGIDAYASRAERPSVADAVDALRAYARFPNVAIKWSQAPRLSAEGYPFRDVVEQLARAIEVFGVERIMWGSDYTVTRHHHTYAEALFYLRDSDVLSASEKERVFGATLRRILHWERSVPPSR